MKQNRLSDEGPITVIVSRTIKSGREQDFETWVKHLNHDAMQCKGYLGYNLIRPADGKFPEYVILFKFDTYDHMILWKESSARANWLEQEESLDMTVGDYQMRMETGLEYWFRTADNRQPPARSKMVLVTLIAMYPTTLGIGAVLQPLTDTFPLLFEILISVIIVITLMTYIIMPFMTHLFGFWLFEAR